MELHVSKGNEKLGPCLNVSQLPGRDCVKDAPCLKECYARHLAAFRPNIHKNWSENGLLWRNKPDQWKADWYESLYLWRKKGHIYARYWVAGDFIDQAQANLAVLAARDFPEIRFMAYTKRWDLQFVDALPKNLLIRRSEWPGREHPTETPAVARPFTTMIPRGETPPKDLFLCPGSCVDCGHVCWNYTNVATKQH